MKLLNWQFKHVYVAIFAAFFVTIVAAAPQPDSEIRIEEIPEQTLGESVQENPRDEKVLVALVEIPPTACTTNGGSQGTCLPSSDCSSQGGTESGTCYSGFGVCCVFIKTCNTQSKFNTTYFVNPSSNTNAAGACTMTLNRASNNICQVRLDFDTLSLSQPDANGLCSSEFLTITGATTPLPMICGENSGQHMYIDVDPNGGALKLSVDKSTGSMSSLTWNVKVSQISCESRYKAPDGCLQYFTETSGTVKSFNFADKMDREGTRQIANQNYGVCIQRASGYCGITWERNTSLIHSFTMSGSVVATLPDLIGNPASSSKESSCTADYIVIPGALDNLGKQNDRFCGVGFPTSVTSTSIPFILYVKQDADELMDEGNRGFQLHYRQTTIC